MSLKYFGLLDIQGSFGLKTYVTQIGSMSSFQGYYDSSDPQRTAADPFRVQNPFGPPPSDSPYLAWVRSFPLQGHTEHMTSVIFEEELDTDGSSAVRQFLSGLERADDQADAFVLMRFVIEGLEKTSTLSALGIGLFTATLRRIQVFFIVKHAGPITFTVVMLGGSLAASSAEDKGADAETSPFGVMQLAPIKKDATGLWVSSRLDT
jgi:hypothetical protein